MGRMVNEDLEDVSVPVEGGTLSGTLAIPEGAHAIVVFAHGSGSSRFSVRNRHVASALRDAGFATFLFDLLTADEEDDDVATRSYRFDISLLASRLVEVTYWLWGRPATASLRVGYFGASTGGAAALVAAAALGPRIGAVVARGSRVDLAGDALVRVTAPTLLVVGGLDDVVLGLNRAALRELRAETQLVVVPGATHLFEEPGALEEVVRQATAWFERNLVARRLDPRPAPSP